MSANLIVFTLLVAAWMALSLAQTRHHQQVFARAATSRARLGFKLGGTLLLIAAFAVAVGRQGWEFGPVTWAVLLGVAALAWSLTLTLSPRRAPWLLPALLIAAVVLR